MPVLRPMELMVEASPRGAGLINKIMGESLVGFFLFDSSLGVSVVSIDRKDERLVLKGGRSV